MPKSNLCVIGLAKMFTDDICKQLSVRMDMFYANIQQILEYELIDALKVESICGKEYLLKEEISIIKRICGYENTLINIEFANLNNETTLQNVKNNCLVVYLKLPQERYAKEQSKEVQSFSIAQLNMDLFDERDTICSNLSDVIIDCKDNSVDVIIEDLIEQIIWYYS